MSEEGGNPYSDLTVDELITESRGYLVKFMVVIRLLGILDMVELTFIMNYLSRQMRLISNALAESMSVDLVDDDVYDKFLRDILGNK